VACAVSAALLISACAGRASRESAAPVTGIPAAPTSTIPVTSSSALTTVAGDADADAAVVDDDLYAGTEPAVEPRGRVVDGAIPTADGRTRHYRLYVPASLASGAPVPLLVALHGGTGSSGQFAANSGFDGLAEANGFLVVYPDGVGIGPDGSGLQTWNGGSCCGPAVRQDVDDVGFVRQLIEVIAAEFPVDPARVVAAGQSNGAIMAYRLACELSDRIVAIGVQAGSLGVDGCTPSQAVSVLHLHGSADTNVPIDGGLGSGIAGVAFRPARSAVEVFAAAGGCGAAPAASTDPSNPDLTVTTWTGCSAGVAVRFVVVEGAGHAWMGHPATWAAAEARVGEPYPDLDASRAIWSFLAAHPRG